MVHLHLHPSLSHCYAQFEVFSQFFIAYYDNRGIYVDELISVVTNYTGSVTRFWFDIGTSIPWSYLDFLADQVTNVANQSRRLPNFDPK